MRIRTTFCWVAILIGTLQGSSPATLGARSLQPPGANSFLGFSPGEVRRYVLGPSDSLLAGELAEWSIGLDSLLSGSSRAIFALEYRWQAPRLLGVEPPAGVITGIESTGQLTLNAHGFPIDSQTHTTVTRAQYGRESHSVHYRFRDQTLHKSVAVGHDTWTLEISILDHKDLDVAQRRGLLAYNPTVRPDCYDPGLYVARAPTHSPAFPTVGRPRIPSTAGVAISRNYDFVCDGRNDMIFANPGARDRRRTLRGNAAGNRRANTARLAGPRWTGTPRRPRGFLGHRPSICPSPAAERDAVAIRVDG